MKIPEGAKRVFEGEIFEVYQWEQKLFDGSTTTFEMLKRPDTVQIIPIIGDKILIAEEEQPTKPKSYTMFGGRVEEGEHPVDAAKREFLEESGYEADFWETLKVYEPLHKMEWKIYVFLARGCRKVGEPNLDPGEKITSREVSFDEFVEIVTSENFPGKESTLDLTRLKLQGRTEELRERLFGK